MALSITEVLNNWAASGVFSYLFPFLIIFAIIFAILQKTKLFGNPTEHKNISGINSIIAISVAFIALLNDYVPTFFASIFPKFGIALAIFLVLLILIGFFYQPSPTGQYPAAVSWIGWALGLGVVIWAWSEWNDMFGGGFDFTNFLNDYFWGIILLLGVGGLIAWIVKGDKP